MAPPLEVICESTSEDIRVRAAVCPCGKYGAVLLGHAEKPVWVTVVSVEPEEVHDAFSAWLAHMDDPDWRETAHIALPLYGAVWEKLPHTESVRQCLQFAASPEWIMDVPVDEAWRCRGLVWGRDDITRTAVALSCVKGAWNTGGDYLPEFVDWMRKGARP